MRDRLRSLDDDFFRDPTANERWRLRVVIAVFVVAMLAMLIVQLRDGVSLDDIADHWPRLLPGLIPIVGVMAMRWAGR